MLGAYNSLANGEKGSFRNEQKPQGRHAKTPTDRGTSKQLKAIHKGGSPNRIIATVCWPCWGLEKKGKKKKKFATVSCTPESEEPPQITGRDRRGRHSLLHAVRRRYQSPHPPQVGVQAWLPPSPLGSASAAPSADKSSFRLPRATVFARSR